MVDLGANPDKRQWQKTERGASKAEQYGVDPDQAFRFAWYGMYPDPPTASTAQIFSRMALVRNVPDVPAEVMRIFQQNLRRIIRWE